MNIETKFKVGDKAFTVDPKTLKIKEFEVDFISALVNADGTRVTLYPSGTCTGYDDPVCFHSRDQLMAHITEA